MESTQATSVESVEWGCDRAQRTARSSDCNSKTFMCAGDRQRKRKVWRQRILQRRLRTEGGKAYTDMRREEETGATEGGECGYVIGAERKAGEEDGTGIRSRVMADAGAWAGLSGDAASCVERSGAM
jgi:hypothetical protein